MLQRWKLILSNWINCYFNEANENEQNVNIESLLSIIAHLRENLNLDESKSSILEAQTVEEFLCEKYPEFKFENGTVEATNQEEISLSASLLLFFVCVNSKNFDMKNAMCNKLSSEDQETILKFSKSLMECPVISVREVQAAITEACGQDIAAKELPHHFTVAETPPALRSLHSEVRRLKAALEAERFDRNYLQEELSRTQNRLERLLKEKEQHKLDILNLKAKISLCCGEETDAKNADAAADKSSKLMRQLQQLEARLEDTQTQLDDVAYERDSYKAKMDELKNDRDKWLALSQQENARVSQLSEELDTERRHLQALKDLVTELRQHNRLNGLDSSSLECDDPDASIHSLQHNSSICSEVCANIVEVQLSEERAKIVVLKQQIQTFQDQINELNQNRETEKKTLENVIAQQENDIFNLRHRVNEEIEEKNNLKTFYDNEMTKLNNEINELEQKLNENNEYSRSIIEKKMVEIETLQEEKMSLLHSLNDETTKLENLIKDLISELDSEKQSRLSMKESYENHLMKLNEKVLNRNNELVELQNSIFEKGEKIETLQIELRKEKEVANEYKHKYQSLDEQNNTMKTNLQYKMDEVQNLNIKIQYNATVIEEMKKEIQLMNTSVSSLHENCITLQSLKEQLLEEIRNRDAKLEETIKEMNHVKEVFNNEKEQLIQCLNERNATVSSLEIQLHNEILFKVGLQDELTKLNIEKTKLSEEIQMINSELYKCKIEIEDKIRNIDAIDLYLQEEKKRKGQAIEQLQKMADEISVKENDIKMLNDKLEDTTKSLQDEIRNNENITEVSKNKLLSETAKRESLELQLNLMMLDKCHVEKDLSLKSEEIVMLREECEELSQKLDENKSLVQVLEQKLSEEYKKYNELNSTFATEMSAIKVKVCKIQNAYTEATKIMDLKITEKESCLLKLCDHLDVVKKNNEKTVKILHKLRNENEILVSKLNTEMTYKTKIEEDYRNLKMHLENLTSEFKDECVAKDTEISCLKVKIQSLLKTIGEKAECLNSLEEKMQQEIQTNNGLLRHKEKEVQEFRSKIDELQLIKENMELLFNKEIEMKTQKIHALQKDNEMLHFTIENDNSSHEVLIKEKDAHIDKLEQQLNENIIKFENFSEYTEELKTSWKNKKAITKAALKEKDEKISELQEMVFTFEQTVNEIKQKNDELTKQIVEIEESYKTELENLASEEKALRGILESEKASLLAEKENLFAEKEMLTQKINEERSIKMTLENEMTNLLSKKKNMLEEKTILVQELSEEQSNKKILEEEKNMLIRENMDIKHQLNKEIETTSTLLEERDCLTQQLIEEKSAKEITEKEKELLVAEKELLKERLIENEQKRSELCKEITAVNQQIYDMQQDISSEKEAVIVLNTENKNLSELLSKQKSINTNLLETNQGLVKDYDQLKKDLCNAISAQEILKSEKEALDIALNSEKSSRDEMESEKNNVTNEKNALAVKLDSELLNAEQEKKILLEEIDNLKSTLVEQKTFLKEKELVVAEMESSLAIEKSARDEIETEKKDLIMRLDDLKYELQQCENKCYDYSSDLINKEKEANQFKIALKQLEADHQYILETNVKISQAMNEGFNKLVQKFSNDNISNDFLRRLIDDKDFKDMPIADACNLIFNIANVLATEVTVLKKLEDSLKSENMTLSAMQDNLKQKDILIYELQTEIKRLEQVINKNMTELTQQSETYATSINSKIIDIQTLQEENKALHNELNDVKVQLEVKVHSLKDKLTDSENLTDKLKKSYECQIENLNVMMTKLTNYLKEKSVELEALRTDKDLLQQTIADSCKVIKTLEDDVKTEKQNIYKLTSDFESERQVLKNMVTVTESVMEDTKLGLSNEITAHLLAIDCLQVEIKELKTLLKDLEMKYQALEMANTSLLSLVRVERKAKQDVEKESEMVRDYLDEVISHFGKERNTNTSVISALEFQEKVMAGDYEKMKNDLEVVQNVSHELKIAMNSLGNELKAENEKLQTVLREKCQVEYELQINTDKLSKVLEEKSQVEKALQEKTQNLNVVQLEVKELKNKICSLSNEKNNLELEKRENCAKMEDFRVKIDANALKKNEELTKLKKENQQLLSTIEENRTVITNLEQLIKHELEENHKLRDEYEQDKLVMSNKCSMLQDYQAKAEKELIERQNEISTLRKEVEMLQCKVELCEQDSKAKDGLISKMSKEKDAVIGTISKELVEEKALREKYEQDLQAQKSVMNDLRNKLEIRALKKENEQLIKAIGQQETFTAHCQETAGEKYTCLPEPRDHYQVDNSSSDNTHSSVESLKTITDLEKIIHDKNRTITTLQTDISYLKSLMAESETKLLDVNKEFEISKESCQQLSNQLKKIVYQKNEEIADLKKQVTKMSATENRASQIIKVSAKYQAMILKRIAEIKSNTVLKELTNFGNSNCDNELKRSLNAGTITMEDLENFLDTTDRHLRRCSEKQIALQKERDRLIEVKRINESEIINMKKFLTELSVSFKTFGSLRDLYGNKLSRVISVQRTVRREILNLDGRVTDATMCKLERGYGAAMQDLSECTMNLERWVERCISRTVSVEKIKQAFTSDSERSSLASPTFHNAGLEVQLEELETLFQKLLEEVARAVKDEGAKESQASTVMEVRAEYEDKLNRMKAKMKDLFNEQMAILKSKQREEIALLERELKKTRDRMEDSKRAYESHIKELTKELWNVGEKYLVKNDEAEWLKKKQRSGSLMSLQHVHSSGLIPPKEPSSRPSDAQSLRSLPVTESNTKSKREGRGLHMSDEEGEVFDNRWLKELSATPRRDQPPGQRLSELKWRNSLCPPHLKSSYPAETQFAPVLDEDDIKAGAACPTAGRQRKEVGITAYKKPGPPTPSKQAGRLSATDSELRESLRVEGDPHTHTERKTSTPARFRAFLRFNKNDTNEGTPRTKRLSSIFRKK